MKFAAYRGARPVFRWLHTWMGLVAGLVIAVISLAGSVIVFRTEIELASAPQGKSVARPVGLEAIVHAVSQARPDARIRRVRFPRNTREPYVLQIDTEGGQESLAIEASTGKVLGALHTATVAWLIDLHRNLLVGKTGRKIVGVLGALLLTLGLSGMLLWLLGACKWKSWISVRAQGSSRRFNYEAHRATGLWASGLLSVIALAGIGLAFPDTCRIALQEVTGSAAPAKAPRISKGHAAMGHSLAEYLQAGVTAMPDGTPVELRLPDSDKNPIELRLHRAGDLAPDANHVYLEPSSAKVIGTSKLSEQPLATRIYSTLAPIHYGDFGGLPIKLLWCLIGIAPSILFVTGLLTWWRPRRRKPNDVAEADLALAGTSRVESPRELIR